MKNFYVQFIVFLAALGGLLFGYDTGAISGALIYIKQEMSLSVLEQELVVALLPLGAVIGALFAGYCTDRFGRRKIILVASLIFILAALFMSLAPTVLFLLIGRSLAGLAIGVSSMTVPLYLSELSPPKKRGFCVSTNQLMVTVGILAGFLVDYIFGQHQDWRIMLGLSAVPAIILFVSMLFLPETPRWLAGNGYDERANGVLRKLGMSAEKARAVVTQIHQAAKFERGSYRECFAKGVRKPLIAGILLAIFQQIVGINTVIYYAPSILTFVGEKDTAALLATLGVGGVNTLVTILALFLLDRVGRRVLLITGTVLLVVALFMMGVGHFYAAEGNWVGMLYTISLFLYIAGFAIGLGCVAWLFIAEVYPLKIRGKAMSLATIANWGSNFIVSLTFLSLLDHLGPGFTFSLYGVIGVIAVIYFSAFIPETKGKTLEEISSYWSH